MRTNKIIIRTLALFIMMSLPSILSSQDRPNIVFMLADDLTRFDIGCYGSKDSKTPTLDILAEGGMKFTRCYQSAPMCSPTRHNIYTGIYPTRTGAYPNHTFANPGTKSIVHHLKPLGYRIALSGKTHIAPEEVFPFEYLGKGKNPEFDLVDGFLKEVKENGEPFCLFLTSNEPHTPWDKGNVDQFDRDRVSLPPYYVDNDETRKDFCRYLAEVNYLDGQVQQALDLLEKHGMTENTIFIFASEQGNAFPFAKWTCYNTGLGSALIVKWPGVIAEGSVSDALVEYSDITPTMIDLAGGKPVTGLDGKSLVPLLKGDKKNHKKYSHGMMTTRGINSGSDYYPIRTVSNGTYRYVLNLTPRERFSNTARMPGWEESAITDPAAAQLVRKHRFRPAIEFYNDLEDPYNQINLAGRKEYRKIEKKLAKELAEWMEYCGDEGIYTELRSFEHMNRFKADGIYLIEEFLEPSSSGNLEVPDKGYYTFYIQGQGSLHINDHLIIESGEGGNDRNNERYGVIALEKGKYRIAINEEESSTILKWSGPALMKTKLNLN